MVNPFPRPFRFAFRKSDSQTDDITWQNLLHRLHWNHVNSNCSYGNSPEKTGDCQPERHLHIHITFCYCCVIQESLLNVSRFKWEAGISITQPAFSGGRALHPDTILSSMFGKVLWWFIFPFSICEVSILLLLVHRISRYFSCSLLNIDAPQHNSALAFASHSGPCHSQRLGYPWELGGSTASLQTCPLC